MGSVTDVLKAAGYKPEKSTVGDKPILKGIYRAMFVDGKLNEPNQYGHSYAAKFKITEKLSGMDSRSQFPEFVGFYDVADNAASAKKGIKKLLNGFFSVGKNVDTSSDEAMYASLDGLKGSAEVFITGYKKTPRKQDASGNWVDNPDGEDKQDFAFLTEKNAQKEALKQQKKDGHPL